MAEGTSKDCQQSTVTADRTNKRIDDVEAVSIEQCDPCVSGVDL